MKNLILITAIIFAFSFASGFEIQAFTNVIKEEGTFLIRDEKSVEKKNKVKAEKMEERQAEIADFMPNTEEHIRTGEIEAQKMEITSEAILVMALLVFGAFYISINYDRRRNSANKEVRDYI